MSFRKLKEEYSDYKGGLLLIDEADAGLFPAAQTNLINMLDRECKELNLQVIMTSHSPVLIEHAFEKSKVYRKKYKTIYLSNTYGDVQVMKDWSWAQISADINTKTISTSAGVSLPKLNTYFEDTEALGFFSALTNRQPLKKFISPMADITLGCSNYLQLIKKKVPEFSEKSIICLDADQQTKVKGKTLKTVILLPGDLPPDQLIFEFLYNLPADHAFWKNELQFTRYNFTNAAREVLSELSISEDHVDLKERLLAYDGDKKPREVFKRFYKDGEFQKLVSGGEKKYNPWMLWIEHNKESTNHFLTQLKEITYNVMKKGYSIDPSKLSDIKVKLK